MFLLQVDGTRVFIFGSVHVGNPSFYPLPLQIDNAFKEAEELWFEAEDAVKGHERFRCPEGKTIRDFLTSLTYYGFRLSQPKAFELFKEFMPCQVALEFERAYDQDQGYTLEYGIERRLKGAAKSQQRPLRFLETSTASLELRLLIPKAEQEAMLWRALFKRGEMRRETRDVFGTWLKGDLDACDRLVRHAVAEFPFNQGYLYGRNRAWCSQLAEIIESGKSAFVCVGYFHLGGDESLQNILKTDFGFTVRQIDCSVGGSQNNA